MYVTAYAYDYYDTGYYGYSYDYCGYQPDWYCQIPYPEVPLIDDPNNGDGGGDDGGEAPKPDPKPNPKPTPTKPDWKNSTFGQKIAAILTALKQAIKGNKPYFDMRQVFDNFPAVVTGAGYRCQATLIINGVSMPVFIEFGVYDDMKIVTNSQPPKQVGPFSYYNPTYGIDKSGKWYSYEFNRYPESGNGALMMTLQVPEEHHDTFYNFLNN